MRRTNTEVLRRGFESMMANWPLIAIRIAESFLFIVLVIISVVAAIIPVAVSAGLGSFDFRNLTDPADVVTSLVADHWMLIIYVLAVITLVLLLLVALHSFVEAANARVYVDAERSAVALGALSRQSFRTFDINRWLHGGRTGWWSVFWVYNIVWGFGGLILLVPLLAMLAGILLVGEPGGKAAVACGGLVLTFLVGIPLAIILAIVTQKAIAVAVARSATASAALRLGWTEIKRDFGRHFVVAFILFAIAFGGAMAISMLTAPMSIVRSIGQSPFTSIAFAPAQVLASILQSIFSAAVGLWFLASYVGLTEEK